MSVGIEAMGFKAREVVVEALKTLFNKNLINVRGGNASVRVCLSYGGECLVYISPRGAVKYSLTPYDIAVVDESGQVVYGQPSVELPLHLEVYRTRRDVYAIVHAHNPLTILAHRLGILDTSILGVEAEYYINTCIESVPKLRPGSMELAKAVANAAKKCDIIILSDHGVVALGGGRGDPVKALYEALDRIILVEEAAKLNIISELLGGRLKLSKHQ